MSDNDNIVSRVDAVIELCSCSHTKTRQSPQRLSRFNILFSVSFFLSLYPTTLLPPLPKLGPIESYVIPSHFNQHLTHMSPVGILPQWVSLQATSHSHVSCRIFSGASFVPFYLKQHLTDTSVGYLYSFSGPISCFGCVVPFYLE